MYGELERRSVSGMSRWTYSIRGIGEQRCPLTLASTCTLSLLSKQLPNTWNGRISIAIQYSNYMGPVRGAILGGAGVKMGMINYVGVQITVVGIRGVMYLMLWRQLKTKTG